MEEILSSSKRLEKLRRIPSKKVFFFFLFVDSIQLLGFVISTFTGNAIIGVETIVKAANFKIQGVTYILTSKDSCI